jgi:predicted nucleic acid-binding protein
VKAFFDTSALLPVFLESHEHHDASLRAFLKMDKKNGCFGAHSLAEVYSTSTRLPGKHRLSGEQALLFLQDLTDRLTVIALTVDEYYRTVKSAAANGIVGGTIYDFLIAQCALKAEVDVIYTWNARHFQQFGSEITKRLRTP